MPSSDKLIRIPIVRNHKYKPQGIKSLVYTMNKFGITPSKAGPYWRTLESRQLMKKLEDGSSGPITAEDQQNDSMWTCAVQIGTPPQMLHLDFDSGSSDLWVKSTALPIRTVAHERVVGITVFDPTKSTTFKDMPKSSWKIQYGDGSGASGGVGKDVLRLGTITIDNQAIEYATRMSDQFINDPSGGLLGLAWGKINTVQPKRVRTPLENMIRQQDIPEDLEVFTVCLGSIKDQVDPDGRDSFFTFGSIDEDLIKRSGQDISWTPIDNYKGFWAYQSRCMYFNDNMYPTPGNKAIMDTGTTLSLVNDDVLMHIYEKIPGARYDEAQQGWLLPTADINSRPNISFAIGEKQFTIAKEHLAFQEVDDTMSYGAIQSRGELGFDIMGGTMLMSIYCIFDVGQQRIGVVQRPEPTPAGQ